MTRRRWTEAGLGAVAALLAGAVISVVLQAQGRIDSMEPLALGISSDGLMASSLGWIAFLLLSAVAGAAYGIAYRYQADRLAATLAGGLLFGLLWWGLLWLTLIPIAAGQPPTWTVAQAAGEFPQLVASIFFGGLMAVGFYAACKVVLGGTEAVRPVAAATVPTTRRVVIVGGGFGGVAAAQRLEHLLAHRPDVSVTIVSQNNYLLFTPMLAGVASGTLIPGHVAVPLRAACPRTSIRAASACTVDPAARTVTIEPVAGGPAEVLHYDELILAAGAVPAFRGLPGLDEHAMTLKSLADAADIHDHLILTLERAEAEAEAVQRARLLTFVVAGGGFAGVEMIAELRDLVRGSLIHFPHIDPDELRFVLVHSRERILPELSPELGSYARERLERRGVEFQLGRRLSKADEVGVTLSDGTLIPTDTFIWTAGNQPATLVRSLAADGAKGTISTDASLRVEGLEHVWAVGDCARIPDPDRDDQPCPPTAQHALRQGKLAGENVVAALDGRAPRPFSFRTPGVLVVLGHNTAAAEIRGRHFSGLLAWLMWRGIYLSKLPGFERKVRVLFDWLLDLVFPRDIVVVRANARPAADLEIDETPARTGSDA